MKYNVIVMALLLGAVGTCSAARGLYRATPEQKRARAAFLAGQGFTAAANNINASLPEHMQDERTVQPGLLGRVRNFFGSGSSEERDGKGEELSHWERIKRFVTWKKALAAAAVMAVLYEGVGHFGSKYKYADGRTKTGMFGKAVMPWRKYNEATYGF